jgi:hypothetical protein
VKGLGHPAVVAGAAVLFALVLHPAARAEAWLFSAPIAATMVTAALALFLALALVARALTHPRERMVAFGAVLVVGALAYDGARGVRGTLSLGVGDVTNSFTEEGPGGRRLGLRPFGFPLGLERVRAGGAVDLSLPAGSVPVELLPTRAVGFGAFRLGAPRSVPTGEVVRLVVSVTGGPEPLEALVTPSEPGHAGDLTIGIERYFPDFALDDKQQPMTRSAESRNPAALLRVDRGAKVYRVFVLGSMPGLHRVEELGRSFALAGVEPDVRVEVAVVQEPAAPVAFLGVLLAAAGLALAGFRSRSPNDPSPAGSNEAGPPPVDLAAG